MASSALAVAPPPAGVVRMNLPRLHFGQLAVARSDARFRVLACGRRWGKSLLALEIALLKAAEPRANIWYVAPTYKMVAIHWRTLRRMLPQGFPARLLESELRLELQNGAAIQFRSADDPDSLRGDGLTFAVVDEAAFMSQRAWTEGLRPSLSDRRGGALIISTPRGHNWFAALYEHGQRGRDSYASFRYPSVSNPYLPAGEVDDAADELPQDVFRQEYEAAFLSSGAVFRYVDEAVREPEGRPGTVVVGVDWAKSQDYTVFVALDTGRQAVVGIERVNQLDYTVQIDRLAQFYRRHGAAAILAEANGVGEPLCELAINAGLPVRRFDTTATSKPRIIGNLVSAFDHKRLVIPDDEVLIGELKAFTMVVSSTGGFRYGAPEGMHDDCVMALAFALEAATYAGEEVLSWV